MKYITNKKKKLSTMQPRRRQLNDVPSGIWKPEKVQSWKCKYINRKHEPFGAPPLLTSINLWAFRLYVRNWSLIAANSFVESFEN